MEKLFLHTKTVDVLIKILEAEDKGEKVYPLSISREVNSPYSYVSKILSEFEKNAIIESVHSGRMRFVKLTDDGKQLAKKLKDIREMLKKDFVTRKKLKIISEFIRKYEKRKFDENEKIFVYAPIMMELSNITKKSKNLDEETYCVATEMLKKVSEIIKKS